MKPSFFVSRALLVSAVFASSSFAKQAEPAPSYTEGQAIEIREGDDWSPGTFVKKEGRKLLVRYEDGTEEWVTADRLKAADNGGAKPDAPLKPGAPGKPGAATKPGAPAKPKQPAYVAGQTLELKYASRWEPVKIVKRQGDWYLVEYTQWKGWREWAEPWRLRKAGSSYDIPGWGTTGNRQHNNDGPPTPKPGDAPTGESTPGGGGPDPFSPPPIEFENVDITGKPREILPVATGGWKVPTAAPDAATIKAGSGPIPLPAGAGKLTGLRVAGTQALLSGTGGINATTDFVRIDLAKSTATAFDMVDASMPMAISPDGGFVVARSAGFHSGTFARLDVWKLTADKPAHVVSFLPFGSKKDVAYAFFTDESHVVTLGDGEIICWDFAKANALWKLTIGAGRYGSAPMTMSPNGKQLAVGTSEGIAILDPASGKVLGMIETDLPSELSYSGDGSRLVGRVGSMLAAWDLASGELVFTIGLPKGVNGQITPIDKEYVLIGENLFSLSKKSVVWRYEGGGATAAFGDRVFTVFADDRRSVLASAVLPHPRAKAAAERATPANLVLKPGIAVALEISTESDQAARDQLKADLTRQLLAGGITVADNAPIKITAKTEMGTSETRDYEIRGPMFQRSTESVTITRKLYKLSVDFNGQAAWEYSTSTSNDPGFVVQVKPGQSIQDAANQRNAGVKADPLLGVKIPTLLAAPIDMAILPTSVWALAGLKEK